MSRILARLRKQMGKTADEVAEAAGISRTHYSQIELGGKKPSLDVALSIASFYGRSVEELFRDGPERPSASGE